MANSRKVHIALNVNDVDQSVRFYRAMFGAEPMKWKPGYAKFAIDEPALNLTLNHEGKAGDRRALNHLGIEVANTSDVIAAKERFEKAGLATFDETNVDCCYALQDKVWITDPDGYRWEIFTVKVGDTRPELNVAGRKPDAPRTAKCCPS
jgi:catechol 2,3-dioxygenase-like lactoylglutathione lyase family enzyme